MEAGYAEYSEAAMGEPDDTIDTDNIHIESDGSSDTCGNERGRNSRSNTTYRLFWLKKKAVYCKKCMLRGILMADPFANMKLLIAFNKHFVS